MKIKSQFCWTIVLVSLLALTAGYAIMRISVLPRFLQIERSQAATNLDRALSAIDREIFHLDKLCRDWAFWDDTYRFLEDRNREYIKSNLVFETFTDIHLSVICFLDNDGHPVWVKAYDKEGEEIEVDEFTPSRLPPPGINHFTSLNDHRMGLMRTSVGPMLFSARPVTDSEENAPPRGIMIMAQLIGPEIIKQLNTQTRLPLEIKALGPGEKKAGRSISRLDEFLLARDTVNDYLGQPILEIKARFPRDISAIGQNALSSVMLASVFSALIILFILVAILHLRIIRPLERLANEGQGGTPLKTIAASRKDEIGDLAARLAMAATNRERESEAEARSSYSSGAAEIAAGLLHNIRNTLNPAASDLNLIREEMGYLPIENIRSALAEIADAPSERHKQLIEYLKKTANITEKFITSLDRRTRDLSRRLNNTEMIIAAHERLARGEGRRHFSRFTLRSVIESAAEVIMPEQREFITIDFDPSLEQQINGRRLAILLIVQNLIKNSAEAIMKAGVADGRIRIWAERVESDQGKMISLSVNDNGCGIAPKDLEHIFSTDFSTREAVAGSGIGLHWCANTCRSLNGRIKGESDGPGRGATFTVTLPLAEEKDGE